MGAKTKKRSEIEGKEAARPVVRLVFPCIFSLASFTHGRQPPTVWHDYATQRLRSRLPWAINHGRKQARRRMRRLTIRVIYLCIN